jgi:hypothetical protein
MQLQRQGHFREHVGETAHAVVTALSELVSGPTVVVLWSACMWAALFSSCMVHACTHVCSQHSHVHVHARHIRMGFDPTQWLPHPVTTPCGHSEEATQGPSQRQVCASIMVQRNCKCSMHIIGVAVACDACGCGLTSRFYFLDCVSPPPETSRPLPCFVSYR